MKSAQNQKVYLISVFLIGLALTAGSYHGLFSLLPEHWVIAALLYGIFGIIGLFKLNAPTHQRGVRNEQQAQSFVRPAYAAVYGADASTEDSKETSKVSKWSLPPIWNDVETTSHDTNQECSKGNRVLVYFDGNGVLIDASECALDLLNIRLDSVKGKHLDNLEHYFGNVKNTMRTIRSAYRAQSAQELSTKDGLRQVFWMYDTALDQRGNIKRIIATGHDIDTLFKPRSKDEALHQTDALTGILDHNGFDKAIAAMTQETHAVVYFIDITNFTNINAVYGRGFGDRVLVEMARSLKALFPEDSIIGRFSGDEFIVVTPEKNRVEHFVNHLKKPLLLMPLMESTPVEIHKSVGLAYYPEDASRLVDTITCANLAAKATKKNGQTYVKRYKPAMQESYLKQKEMTDKIQEAIREDRIQIHFQEVLDVESGRVQFLEALARWRDEDYGDVAPETLFAVAREAAMTAFVDYYLINQALKQFKYLKASHEKYYDTVLSLNVAPETLLDVNFMKQLNAMVSSHALKRASIYIEISEATFVNDTNICASRIMDIKNAGYNISLDDFGKAYSSLSVLDRIPFDVIKIDAVFIAGINGVKSQEIIKMIRNIALAANKAVIAEGVETQPQSEKLKKLGCTLQQGFFHHRPTLM